MDKRNSLRFIVITILVLLLGNGTSAATIAVPIFAMVDIKPDTCTCDKDMNHMKEVTAYIEIPGYDVNKIDISTVKLSTEKGYVISDLSPTKVDDYDNDKIPDLMVKFDMHDVHQIVDMRDTIKLTISGMVSGLKFEGSDEIRVKGKEDPIPPPPVPEQSTIVLVSAGLLGMMLVLRRSK